MVVEARVGKPTMKALCRTARAAGFDAAFGDAPPPTATFSVSCGGLAIFTKLPLSIMRVYPEALAHWSAMGRLLVTKISAGTKSILVAALYGFAPSHEDFHANDDLIGTVMSWISGQKVMAVLAGDFNATSFSCAAIASCREFPLWRVSPEEPTTKGKTGHSPLEGVRPAIDHIFVNRHFMELSPHACVRKDLSVSDHYAVQMTFRWESRPLNVWRWPRPLLDIPGMINDSAQFPSSVTSFVSWSALAQRWIKETHGSIGDSKLTLCIDTLKLQVPKESKEYASLRKVLALIQHMERSRVPTRHMIHSLKRKLRALNPPLTAPYQSSEDLALVVLEVDARIKDHLESQFQVLLRSWRAKVLTWSKSSPDMYRYVRNDLPPKIVTITQGEELVNDPGLVGTSMADYWTKVEARPAHMNLDSLSATLEDRYSLFVPHFPFLVNLTGTMVKEHVDRMRVTTWGPDSWSVQEAKQLPAPAWDAL